MKFKHLGTNNFEDYSYRDGLDLCRLLDIHEEDAWYPLKEFLICEEFYVKSFQKMKIHNGYIFAVLYNKNRIITDELHFPEGSKFVFGFCKIEEIKSCS